MNLVAAANNLIEPHEPKVSLRKRQYGTDDIVNLVQEVIKTDTEDTKKFARLFPANEAGLKMLFDFVDANFLYVEDPAWNQWVQTPSYIWYTRRGDCKSFTVFISSVLRNMGIEHWVRYVSYSGNRLAHVYPVALLGGKEIPLDVVWKKQENGRFGAEKKYKTKKDYLVEGLYKLGSTAATSNASPASVEAVQAELVQMQRALADIPDSIIEEGPGDITRFSKGELDRYIWADRMAIFARQENNPFKAAQYRGAAQALQQGNVAGIGSIENTPLGRQVDEILMKASRAQQPAFQPFQINFEVSKTAVSGVIQDIGKFFTNLWKKFVNWLFKGVAKKMGPYFIFLWIKKDKIKSEEIKRRIAEQEKTFKWIKETGRLDSAQLMGQILNGIKEETGKTPAELLNEVSMSAAGKAIAGIAGKEDELEPLPGKNTPPTPTGGGALDPKKPLDVNWSNVQRQDPAAQSKMQFLQKMADILMKAIQFVIEVIKKIASLFKKKEQEGGEVNRRNGSDFPTLNDETGKEGATAQSSEGAGGLLGLAAALVGFIVFR